MWQLDHKEGWVLKNWCFQIVVLEKTLESPLDNKEIQPVNLNIHLMLKLKLQYFGHLMWRGDLLGKTLMLGKTEGRRRRHWQRMRWLDGISGSMGMTLRKFGEIVEDRGAWHATFHEVTKAWTWLENSNQKDPELSYMRALNHLSPGLLSTRENACTLSLWVGISALLLS